jgi:hypothetical protein
LGGRDREQAMTTERNSIIGSILPTKDFPNPPAINPSLPPTHCRIPREWRGSMGVRHRPVRWRVYPPWPASFPRRRDQSDDLWMRDCTTPVQRRLNPRSIRPCSGINRSPRSWCLSTANLSLFAEMDPHPEQVLEQRPGAVFPSVDPNTIKV